MVTTGGDDSTPGSPLCHVMQPSVHPVLSNVMKGRLSMVLVTTKVDARSIKTAQWVRGLWQQPENRRLYKSRVCASVIRGFMWEVGGERAGNSWELTGQLT